jgi:N-terminal half of MaoC dehydratase
MIMALDRKHIGFRLAPFTVVVDLRRLQRFVAAIGAKDADTSSGMAPPTYLKVIEGGSSREIMDALGVDLRRVMHAEQEFDYGAAFGGGDRLTVERVVSDIYERKQGALEFIVVESTIRNADGVLVGRSRQSIVVRDPSGAVQT